MTQIFNTYEDFINRIDKEINGVNPFFASKNKKWFEKNTTNTGCWCCIDCSCCNNCSSCIGCNGCNGLANSYMCIETHMTAHAAFIGIAIRKY